MIPLSGDGWSVTLSGNPVLSAAELDLLYWESGGHHLSNCSNKFNPIMESKQQRSGIGSYWDRNPRRWESRQIKVANRRWRRSGKYNGQTFDDFESLARSRFSALEDRC